MNSLFEFYLSFKRLNSGLISLVVSSSLYAAPSGGTVISGNVTFNQNGKTTNINQSSNKASINWQDFSINKNETVNFNQPNKNSITLNRVIGSEKSIIDGALNANGQIWILNSNGTLFGKNAKVNTSGLLITTKELSDEDFNKGKYNFKGDSKATIENQGTINLNDKAYVAFIANSVINNGEIKVHQGTINLVGANEFSILLEDNSNPSFSLKVNKGVLDSLVENNHLIVANGGNIYLTTNAKDELLKGVVNNRGIIEASSIDNLKSEVILFAHGGVANINGVIEAKNGFVETSAKEVNIDKNTKITAKNWLIDPMNLTISDSTAYETSLNNNTNITIQTDTIGNEEGNIYIDDAITWNTTAQLTLNAYNDIVINKDITAINNGKLALFYGQGTTDGGISDYYVNAKVNLTAGDNFATQKGSNSANFKNYKVITSLGNQGSNTGADLQGINGNNSGNYVLGADINAGDTSSWNSGAGFDPIMNFSGEFDGLGHTISNLYISRPTIHLVGLFGSTAPKAIIKNIGLKGVDISANFSVGGLVGYNEGTILSSYVIGKVKGEQTHIGGLVGNNAGGTINNSYSVVDVEGKNNNIGGLVGLNNINGTITNSYTISNVKGIDNKVIGGFVGTNRGTIINSYASSTVTGSTVKSAFAYNEGNNAVILDSFYNQEVSGISQPGVTGLTTAEMSYGGTFKSAGWDIVADSSVIYNSPIRKYDSTKNGYVWAISPLELNYNLDEQSTTYNGLTQNYILPNNTLPILIPNGYEFLNLDGEYKIQREGSDVIGYKDAGVYDNIKVVLTANDEFLAIAPTGNIDGKIIINKANATVIGNSKTTVYNGLDQSINGFTVNGLVNGETDSVLTGIIGSVTGKDAGVYNMNLGGNDKNYNLTFIDGKLTINKANATVIGNSETTVYNGLNQSINGFTVNGLVNGETSSVLTGVTVGASGKDAGTYTIKLEGSDKNYNLTFIDGKLTIEKAKLIVQVNDSLKQYDSMPFYGGDVNYLGFVNNETVDVLKGSLVYSGNSQGAVEIGNYVISASGLDSNNYDISYENGKLVIKSELPIIPENPDDENLKEELEKQRKFLDITQMALCYEDDGLYKTSLNINSSNTNIKTSFICLSNEIKIVQGGIRLPDIGLNNIDNESK